MLRCPLASCKYGILNQRNAKQAARAHFREFHRDGSRYNIKIEAKNGFGFVTFPEIKDTNGVVNRPRTRGKGGKRGGTEFHAKGLKGQGGRSSKSWSKKGQGKQNLKQGDIRTFLHNANNNQGEGASTDVAERPHNTDKDRHEQDKYHFSFLH